MICERYLVRDGVYEREDRIELARIYFRLCSHLASQGHVVVISAIAMYKEISNWLEEYVPSAMEFYLNVHEAERQKRDQEYKNVYGKIGNSFSLYDPPGDSAISLNNYGDVTPDSVAESIIEQWLNNKGERKVDLGRVSHWDKYYSSLGAPECHHHLQPGCKPVSRNTPPFWNWMWKW